MKNAVPKWTDATSYSKNERGEVEPRSWEVRLGPVRLIVTRRAGLEGWYAQSYPNLCQEHPLVAEDVEKAKEEAIYVLARQMERVVDARAARPAEEEEEGGMSEDALDAVNEMVREESKRFNAAVRGLLERYEGRWVVFKNGKVASDHDGVSEAYGAGVAQFGVHGGFALQLVARNDEPPYDAMRAPTGKCDFCKVEDASHFFEDALRNLAATCNVCSLRRRLEHARGVAESVPTLERELREELAKSEPKKEVSLKDPRDEEKARRERLEALEEAAIEQRKARILHAAIVRKNMTRSMDGFEPDEALAGHLWLSATVAERRYEAALDACEATRKKKEEGR